jgi:hypothetical protein
MDRQHMSGTAELDPAAVEVIDSYLHTVACRLPAYAQPTPAMLAELRDDLFTATETLVAETSSGPVAAARAAVADFGDSAAIASALRPELTARRTRRLGLGLFASGPVVGGCWLAAVVLGTGGAPQWRWLLVIAAPVVVVGAWATELAVLTTGRLCRWLRPGASVAARALVVAGVAAGVGDLLLLAGCAVLLLVSSWPSPLFLIAVAASGTRLVLLGAAIRRLGLGR